MPPAVHPGWIYGSVRGQTSIKPEGEGANMTPHDFNACEESAPDHPLTHPQLLTAMMLDTRTKGYVSMLAKNCKKVSLGK